MRWMPSDEAVLDFVRGESLRCIANLSAAPVELPPHAGILVQSADLVEGMLPPDAAVWVRVAAG